MSKGTYVQILGNHLHILGAFVGIYNQFHTKHIYVYMDIVCYTDAAHFIRDKKNNLIFLMNCRVQSVNSGLLKKQIQQYGLTCHKHLKHVTPKATEGSM